MDFEIGDQVRQGMRVATVTDVGTLLVQVKTSEGVARVACTWELEKIAAPPQRLGRRFPPL
ncbi:hypothetical protein [Mycolicibacterium stellerae]|uniref:hypothetical protein n=1 Tax=Mycolicibacterium stellerae TaxID=2358193 RepID=UPI000F0B264B|nr:hypothetical protein [Mycolicibacterium stellerae]